eukprot:scaffold4241_cov145-Isochrysis_galbana.AAC.4
MASPLPWATEHALAHLGRPYPRPVRSPARRAAVLGVRVALHPGLTQEGAGPWAAGQGQGRPKRRGQG